VASISVDAATIGRRERSTVPSIVHSFPFDRIATGRTATIGLVDDANWPLPRRTFVVTTAHAV